MTSASYAATDPTDIGRLLRAAWERYPDQPACARRLARHLYLRDELEELSRVFGPAPADGKDDPECLHYAGLAALTLGDAARAETCLSRAVLMGHDASRGHRAKALLALGRTAEARALALRTLNASPGDDAASQVAFSLLLGEGRHAELWTLCARLRDAAGWTVRMVSAMALAAHTHAQLACVRRLVDHEVWIERASLAPGHGWADSVADRLRRASAWTPLPRTKATSGGGRRIEKLQRLTEDPLLADLFERIRVAIGDYVDRREVLLGPTQSDPGSDHPMVALRPATTAITSWAVAVHGNGYEDWHIHPDGWLSGVYYVEVPDAAVTAARNAGCIEFGPYPLGPARTESAWSGWMVRPRAGELLLFPSYMGHRTWPTGVDRERVCIAFDVLRRGVCQPDEVVAAPPGTKAVGLDDRLRRTARVVSTRGHTGLVLAMNVDSGRYLTLDDAGTLVWDMLEKPCRLREAAAELSARFDIAEARIADELGDLAALMITNDLVQRC